MEEKKFPENTEIVKQNEITENVYFVYDGKLEAYKSFDKNPSHLVKEIQKGDLFNEISVLYNHKNPATIKTINECTLFTIDRNTYVNILKQNTTQQLWSDEVHFVSTLIVWWDTVPKKKAVEWGKEYIITMPS